VLEVRDERGGALNARVRDGGHLLRVEPVPPLAVEAAHEGLDQGRAGDVDEGVADVALVLEVDRQVEKVIGALQVLINGLQSSNSSWRHHLSRRK